MFKLNSPLHKQIIKKLDEERLKKENNLKRKFYMISERYVPSTVETNLDHPGDVKIDMINKHLNRLYRSKTQKEFHQIFLSTCLRLIYGDDYEKERHRVMEKYGFPTKKQQCIVIAARRLGKTFAVAYFAAVLVVCLDDVEISIFSASKRQSMMMSNHVYKFLQKLGWDDRVLQKNEEKMRVRTFNGKESKLNAYPAIISSLKGVSASLILLEEAAIIPPALLDEVVMPLFQLDHVSFIAISTITDSFNFLTRYLEMKDDNDEPLFYSRRLYLACKKCIEAEIAGQCNHMNHLLPDWSSGRKRKIINAIMKDSDLLAREIAGVANSINQPAFNPKIIKKFIDQERYKIPDSYDYPVLFISIDPSACGKNSDFAITTMMHFKGEFIIVGMESFNGKNALENHQLIIDHCNRFDDYPMFCESIRVFIIESNLALESEHIKHTLRENKLERYIIMNENEKKTGFLTTNALKSLAVERIREYLANKILFIAEEVTFVCVSHNYKDIIKMLHQQIHGFGEIIKPSGTKIRKFYSGKMQGQKDDLIMTLLLNVAWSNHYYKLINR